VRCIRGVWTLRAAGGALRRPRRVTVAVAGGSRWRTTQTARSECTALRSGCSLSPQAARVEFVLQELPQVWRPVRLLAGVLSDFGTQNKEVGTLTPCGDRNGDLHHVADERAACAAPHAPARRRTPVPAAPAVAIDRWVLTGAQVSRDAY